MKIKLIEDTTQKVDIRSNPDYKFKPTLKQPTPMGQKVDNEYKKQVNIKQNSINEIDANLSEDEKAIKRKIFKLNKMESLVHNDDKLSRIYNKIIQDDPETKFGYHYNEVIMTMLFNDYVLNNPKYMEKYKNAVPKKKKRRDKTGINQLIKKGEEYMEKKDDSNSEQNLDSEVNEIFNSLFGGGFDTSKYERNPDEVQPNDLFVFDSNSKKLIDIIPREKIQDFRAKYNDLFNQELVKIASPKSELEVKNLKQLYKIPTIKFASEFDPLGESDKGDNTKQWTGQWNTTSKPVKENITTTDSFNANVSPERFNPYLKQIIMSLKNLDAGDKLINSLSKYNDFIKNRMVNGDEPSKVAQKISNDWYGVDETTGAVSSGAFNTALDNNSEDKIEETTTSASSGQYSSPVAFSKNPKKGRFFNRPIWNGGIVISEGVDYITNPEAFKKYATLVESVNEIEEAIGDLEKYIDNGDQTNYIKTLTNLFNMYKQKINIFGDEYKQHYNDLMKDISDEIDIAKQKQNDFINKKNIQEEPNFADGIKTDLIGSGQPASKVDKMTTRELENKDGLFKGGIKEHHLHTKDDKIAFILQNDAEGKYSTDSLQSLPDQEVDKIYRNTEIAMGLTEQDDKPSHIPDNAIEYKDFWIYPSNDPWQKKFGNNFEYVSKNYDADWSGDGWKNNGLFGATKTVDDAKAEIDDMNQIDEKAKSKAQQKFMGMVHALQKGDIDSSDVSDKVVKAANSMSDKDAEDFASTKHKGLPNHVKTDEGIENIDPLTELGNLLFPNTDMSISQLKTAAQDILQKFFKNQTPEQAVELLKAKIATNGVQVAEQLVNTLNKNIMKENYKTVISKKLIESKENKKVKSIKEMNNEERLAQFKAIYESMIDPNPTTMSMNANNPTSMKNDTDNQVGNQPFPQMNEEKWEQNAVSHKGALHKKLGIPTDKEIPMERINSEIEKLNKKYKNGEKMSAEDNHFKKMLTLAKTFKKQNESFSDEGYEITNDENIDKIKDNFIPPSINEDRKSNSMLNLDRIKSQNASNIKSDNSEEDALSSEKVYGFPDKKNDIHKSEIYPNPDDFYIEQDLDKVQNDMTSFDEIEKEKLAQGGFKKEALKDVGDAVREKDFIPKRNATEEEQKKIMLNRGAGMEDIVYDNKPSQKFEDRMKKDMGDQIYKNRQEKMAYKGEAPMYNKDTQPIQNGDVKFNDNKYDKKYNTESVTVTGVYIDPFGKRKFKEFNLNEAIEIENINESFIKIDLDGFGNKYTQKVKLDESIAKEISETSYYIKNNLLYKKKTQTTQTMNESLLKMKHLMNYKPSKFLGK